MLLIKFLTALPYNKKSVGKLPCTLEVIDKLRYRFQPIFEYILRPFSLRYSLLRIPTHYQNSPPKSNKKGLSAFSVISLSFRLS